MMSVGCHICQPISDIIGKDVCAITDTTYYNSKINFSSLTGKDGVVCMHMWMIGYHATTQRRAKIQETQTKK
jgi:hypothetical protein